MRLRRRTAGAALVAIALVISACSGSTGSSDTTSGSTTGGTQPAGTAGGSGSSGGAGTNGATASAGGATTGNGAAGNGEPPAGTPADAAGALPMPQLGQRYDNPQPRDNVKDGGTLNVSVANYGPNFNWFSAAGSLDTNDWILFFIAPRLWTYSMDGTPTPNPDYLLSAEVTSQSPMIVHYKLNPKGKYNDGSPLDWRSLETTWKTQNGTSKDFAPSTTSGYESIKSVVKGDTDFDAIVTFDKPFYPYQALFNQIEPPKNADPAFYKDGWVNNLHPELGAGPFIPTTVTPDQIVLERNPKWWGDPAKLDKVVIRKMESNPALNAFVNGELDAVTIGTAEDLKQVVGLKGVTIRRGYNLRVANIALNTKSAFMKDPQARRAVILGTDRELLAKIAFKGLDWSVTPPGSQMLFPFQAGYQDNMADLHFDSDQAKKVLDEAGWKMGPDGYRTKDGVKASLQYLIWAENVPLATQAKAMQQMMKAIGVEVIIDSSANADAGKKAQARDYDLIDTTWAWGESWDFAVYSSALYGQGTGLNYSGVGSPELDAKFKALGSIPDAAMQLKAFNEAEKEVLHQYGIMPLYNPPDMQATKAGLANYGPTGFLTIRMQDIGWQK